MFGPPGSASGLGCKMCRSLSGSRSFPLLISVECPRLAMQNVTNIISNSKLTRNMGGSSSSGDGSSPSEMRHRMFVEAAAKLPPGGRLVPCKHCSAPSVVSRSTQAGGSPSSNSSAPSGGEPNEHCNEVATCSSCGLVFCLACRCDAHEGPCRSLGSGSDNSERAGGVSSSKSKARLRRL